MSELGCDLFQTGTGRTCCKNCNHPENGPQTSPEWPERRELVN